MRAEAFETDGLRLSATDLPQLVPVNVVDVGVLCEFWVCPVQVVLVLSQDEQIEARNAYRCGYAEDEDEVGRWRGSPLMKRPGGRLFDFLLLVSKNSFTTLRP